MLAYGLYRFATGTLPVYEPPPEWVQAQVSATEGLGLLLILRAFSSGSVALTGTEAVSNGVPAFQPPESRRARTVLIMMVVLRHHFSGDELPGWSVGHHS